jgi:hypothetical protein
MTASGSAFPAKGLARRARIEKTFTAKAQRTQRKELEIFIK